MSKQIKNIIFDFGGVIINISHSKVENAFRNLGVQNFEELFNKAVQSDLFKNLETGKISDQNFRDELRNLTGLSINDDVLDKTWNQIIGDYPTHRIELLKLIKSNYSLYLLSNTNNIHYKFYIHKFKEEFGYDFISLFEKTFWSFKIGCRKPDDEAYLYVIEKSNLAPEETLFIDDSIQNIEAARNLKIHTVHLDHGLEINDLFDNGWLLEEKVEKNPENDIT